jgi:hypothetical protein
MSGMQCLNVYGASLFCWEHYILMELGNDGYTVLTPIQLQHVPYAGQKSLVRTNLGLEVPVSIDGDSSWSLSTKYDMLW